MQVRPWRERLKPLELAGPPKRSEPADSGLCRKLRSDNVLCQEHLHRREQQAKGESYRFKRRNVQAAAPPAAYRGRQLNARLPPLRGASGRAARRLFG